MTSPPPEPFELPDAIVRDAVPDDDIVLAYAMRGEMARYVEGVAARNPAFREELEVVIEGLEEAGETISAAARAWREPVAAMVPIAAVRPKPGGSRAARRWALIALAAAFLLVAGGYHTFQVQEAERIQREKDEELAAAKQQLARLEAELRVQQEAMALAQRELVTAQSDVERANAQAKFAAAQEAQRKTLSQARAAAGPSRSAKAACQCAPGDPLCSCL